MTDLVTRPSIKRVQRVCLSNSHDTLCIFCEVFAFRIFAASADSVVQAHDYHSLVRVRVESSSHRIVALLFNVSNPRSLLPERLVPV